MAVGVNHRHDGLFRPMLIIKIECSLGGFGRNQRVEHGDAILALDDGHVRQVVVANLIDTVSHLEQAGDVDQLGLPPQTGVGSIRSLFAFFDKRVFGRVPDYIARGALNDCRWQGSNKSFVSQLKGRLVVERQLLEQRIVSGFGGFRCRLWFLGLCGDSLGGYCN
ncbi:hypothetical protein D3C87_1401280 [compost metagenome]